ncbi:primosomal protein N' [Lachnoclostridium sp. An14]|uniref:replication restart helicase PriA n=1 Tax=Lachnoclostridium sp. An14 TaxID=1965562 RepID=UPI000B392FCA|nr:primosomal protein N' [Lachnoclostridium sp. An14]OUQ21909.1 primosomal protein N' [Lachnoclostridium sp. An14]
MAEEFANVIVDISHERVDRPFQYRVPERLRGQVGAGSPVLVPFGAGNRLRKGYVVELTDRAEYDPARIKELDSLDETGYNAASQLIRLAWWMKEQYGSTMNQALKTVLPVKEKIRPVEKKTIRTELSKEQLKELLSEAERKHYRARARLFSALLDMGEVPWELAARQLRLTAAALKPMEEKGWIFLDREAVYRNPIRRELENGAAVELNEEQQAAARAFIQDYRAGHPGTYLLYGITGSGKTEVYMEMMEAVLRDGRQVIVLIPEIALTYQTVMRFYRRFGQRVSVINSRLSKGERYDQFERARKGEIQVMIGPRSALFTPFENLGLIVIDEEQEGAYKSELAPRYHAREVAARRAAMAGAGLVLGSATPSLEAFSRAERGEYRLLTLTGRAKKESRLAQVEVVDLREELRAGNRSIFSRRLQELMEDRLGKGEQIMLFLNRRGYSSFVSCRSCGEALSCPHCDVSLTLHWNGRLKCHYCGYEILMPERCPSCGSPYIAGFGTGTQRIEEMTRKMFPGARVLRMDMDTTSKKGGHEEILSAFGDGEADILIGTQMIVKGHDFPKVTLVGVLAADLSLHAPDYACGERTFQILTQAAGRAGRGADAGNVVIQTYMPEHYSIRTAARQDYEGFYREEMAYRRMLHYPPALGLLTIQAASQKEETLSQAAEKMRRAAEQAGDKETGLFAQGLEITGPVEAPVYKVNDIYRKILYIKHENYGILLRIRKEIEALELPVMLSFDLQ